MNVHYRYLQSEELMLKLEVLEYEKKKLREQGKYWKSLRRPKEKSEAGLPKVSIDALGDFIESALDDLLNSELTDDQRKSVQFIKQQVVCITAAKTKRLWDTRTLLHCYIALKKSSASYKRMKDLVTLPCAATLVKFGKEMGVSYKHSGVNLSHLRFLLKSYFSDPESSSLLVGPDVDEVVKQLLAYGTILDDEFHIHGGLVIHSASGIIVGFTKDFSDLATLEAIALDIKKGTRKSVVANSCLVFLFQPFLSPKRFLVGYYTSNEAVTAVQLLVSKLTVEYGLRLAGLKVALSVHDSALWNITCDKIMRDYVDTLVPRIKGFGRVTDPSHYIKRVLGVVQKSGLGDCGKGSFKQINLENELLESLSDKLARDYVNFVDVESHGIDGAVVSFLKSAST